MSWEEELFAYLDDLEGQAGALYAAERAPELADRSRAEYQSGHPGHPPHGRRSTTTSPSSWLGVGAVSGRSDPSRDRLVPAERTPARTGWSGSRRSLPCRAARTAPSQSWPGPRSPGSASAPPCAASQTAAEPCSLHLTDGHRHDGTLLRVGADFVELATGEAGRLVLVALDHVAAVQSRG